MLDYIKAIAIPRFPGTSGEQQVQNYLVNFFREHGFDVEEQKFTISKFPLIVLPRLGLVIICLLVIAAFYLLALSRLASVAIAVLAFVVICNTTRWRKALERFYDLKIFGQFGSRNIIATKQAVHSHVHLIYMAHYDSKSQTFPSYIRFLLFIFVLTTASISLLWTAASTIFGLGSQSMIYPIGLICFASLVLQFNFTHNQSPGAYDNASGAALLLELAHRISQEELSDYDVSFIATGAEEVGLGGAIKLVQSEMFRKRFAAERTVIVNFDSVGAGGKVLITDRYGIPPIQTGKQLSALAVSICRELGVKHRRTWLPTGALMDHIPFSYHGYQSITISSGGLNKAVLSMHSKNDVIENIDTKALENCFRLGYEIKQRCRNLAKRDVRRFSNLN